MPFTKILLAKMIIWQYQTGPCRLCTSKNSTTMFLKTLLALLTYDWQKTAFSANGETFFLSPSPSPFDSKLYYKVVVETAHRLSSWVTKAGAPCLCGKAVWNSQSSYFRWGSFICGPGERVSEEIQCDCRERSVLSWESALCSSALTHSHWWRHFSCT